MKVKVWFYLALLFSSSLASFSAFSLSNVSTSADALSMSNPREMTWKKQTQLGLFLTSRTLDIIHTFMARIITAPRT